MFAVEENHVALKICRNSLIQQTYATCGFWASMTTVKQYRSFELSESYCFILQAEFLLFSYLFSLSVSAKGPSAEMKRSIY